MSVRVHGFRFVVGFTALAVIGGLMAVTAHLGETYPDIVGTLLFGSLATFFAYSAGYTIHEELKRR